jgi:hypothetical protein
MAKKFRRFARRAYGKAKRYVRSNKAINPIETILGSAAYGAVRSPIASAIPDVPQLGGYSDNVILGGIAALAAWKGNGLIKKAGMVVLANESFIAGAKASQGLMGGTSTGNTISLQNINY